MAVFHRRLRQRKWTRDEFQTTVRQFSKDDIGGYWTWLALDGRIVEESVRIYATLPESIFLRTADACIWSRPCIMAFQRFTRTMFIKGRPRPLLD